MKDEAAFLQAIQEAPDDSAARLVYADWLEERGDLRAEYLRLEQQWSQAHRHFAQPREGEGPTGPWGSGLARASLRLAQLREQIDPTWVKAMTRPPEGGRIWVGLTWREIDPRQAPFDPEAVRPHLEEVLTLIVSSQTGKKGGKRPRRHRWEETRLIGEVIVSTYGPWASGWDFSRGEGGGGGVLDTRNWCCPEHSLFRDGYSAGKVAEHADRILRAVGEWRAHLERLADLFEAVEVPRTRRREAQLAIRRAIARLVTWVVELTGCDDAWYNYLERTLSWLLEHVGMGPGHAGKIVKAAVGGQFHSWAQPTPEELEQAADKLARLAAPHLPGPKGGK